MRRLHTVMVLAFFAAFWAADFGLAAAQEAVLPPANVRADQVGFLPHLRVSWDASTTAGEVVYRVYRSTSADSLGSIVRNSETDLEYVDATPAYGTAYYYRVLTLLGGVPSALSEQASASPVVPSPAEVRAEDAQKGGTVNLTWQMADPGAALEFEVYRSTSATRYGSRIASKVSGTSFVDGRVTNGITYYYHVRAIAPSGDASEFASASPVVPGNANPEKPRLSVSTTTYEGRDAVSLSWTAPAGSSIGSYRVYRSDAEASAGGFRIETTARKFVDTDARLGHTYYYHVQALNSEGELLSESERTMIRFGQVDDSAVVSMENFTAEATGTSGQIRLSWDALAKSISYVRIYRNTVASQGSRIADRVRGTSHTDRSLENGVTYYYSVALVDIHGNERSTAALVYAVPFATKSLAPDPVSALRAMDRADGSSIALSWANPPLHEYASLVIYRSTNFGEQGDPIRTGLRSSSYIDTQSIQSGQRYFYTVVPFGEGGIAAENNVQAAGIATLRLANESFDTDGDGLPDTWERLNGYHPHLKDTPDEDSDQDGLGVFDEYRSGTSPWNPDSDGDGYADGTEVLSGYDPLGPGRAAAPARLSNSASGAFAYQRARLSSISEEQRLAVFLRQQLESEFGAGRIPNPRSHWPTLVNAYIYGGYTASEIAHTLRFGPGLVHPALPADDWRKSGEYRRKQG